MTISTLATGFAALGVAVGLPSVAVLFVWLVNAVRVRRTAGSKPDPNFGANPDALLLMLKGVTIALGALSRGFGSLGQFLLKGLAVVAAGGVILATACWFTGRGLHAHADWARFSAFALLGIILIPSLLLALSLHRLLRGLMLAVVMLCLLGLQTLWIGYGTATP